MTEVTDGTDRGGATAHGTGRMGRGLDQRGRMEREPDGGDGGTKQKKAARLGSPF